MEISTSKWRRLQLFVGVFIDIDLVMFLFDECCKVMTVGLIRFLVIPGIAGFSGNADLNFLCVINLSCIFFVFHHSFECIGNYLVNLQSNSLSLNICREKPHDILRVLTLKPNLSCNSFSKWRVSYFARSNKVAPYNWWHRYLQTS